MPEPDYLSFSFRFQGPQSALSGFLDRLGIAPELRFIGTAPESYDHLARRQSAVEGGALRGDFRIGAEVFLFDVPRDGIEDILRAASRGCAIAVPDERPGASPFADLLWLDGSCHAVEVMDDEITEETYLHGRDDLRRRLAALAPAATGPDTV